MVVFPIMKIFFPTLFSLILLPSLTVAISNSEAALIARRQLESFSHSKAAHLPPSLEFDIKINVEIHNPCLRKAYIAFQALKNGIHSDPNNFTGNWVGPYVCSYNGVFCSPSPSNHSLNIVSAIDLNGADIAGFLPAELGLLADVAVFHANSNRFCGIIPESFAKLKRLFELDLSNNRLVGAFPTVVLKMPALKYLDLRYNDFEGRLPQELFDKDLDALFLNNNRFESNLPENFGNSTVSVAVLANNRLTGCVPRSIRRMWNLNELILMNNKLDGCLPVEAGFLNNVTVFDVGFNSLSGILPESFGGLKKLEELDLSHNLLTGVVPKGVCKLPKISNFTFSFNYFNKVASECANLKASDRVFDDSNNCISGRKHQRGAKHCARMVSRPVDCHKFKCGYASSPQARSPAPPVIGTSSPPPPPQVYSPPPPVKSPPQSVYSPPPPYEGILPPAGGYSYASPPPPIYPGY